MSRIRRCDGASLTKPCHCREPEVSGSPTWKHAFYFIFCKSFWIANTNQHVTTTATKRSTPHTACGAVRCVCVWGGGCWKCVRMDIIKPKPRIREFANSTPSSRQRQHRRLVARRARSRAASPWPQTRRTARKQRQTTCAGRPMASNLSCRRRPCRHLDRG